MKKLLCLLLALTMLFSLVACGDNDTPEPDDSGKNPVVDDDNNSNNTVEPVADDNYEGIDWNAVDAMDHDSASEVVYDYALGEFAEAYAHAKTFVGDERKAYMALAEAKLMESGVFLPIQTQGGNYAMSRVVPRTNAVTTLWGLDEYRYHTLLIANELITAEDRAAVLEMWGEADSADDYRADAKAYLEGKGYTFTDIYNLAFSETLDTWDVIATSYTSDAMFVSGTYDSLMEYDAKGALQYGLAESYEVSDDELTYTFHIRQGVNWVDQQGRVIAPVTADDWVASMQHVADNFDALGYLMTVSDGCGIKNFDAYVGGDIADFAEVGVKAVDEYTLEYTLEAPFTPFITMLGYGCFAPLNRSFYESQGGKFGAEFDPSADTYNYGKTPANIAYCGPYLVTNFTAENTVRYEANPTYWNADAVIIKSINYTYNDGSDTLRAYNDAKAGTTAGAGFNSSALEQAKLDTVDGSDATYFDTYAYVAAGTGTTYCGWMNVNRKVYTNYDDTTVGVSPKTDDDQARGRDAMVNAHFRRAVLMALDRGAYMAASVGEELKYTSVRNSYTPGTFLVLESDTTVEVNGSSVTFPAGTTFGAIEQAQLDADGVTIKVWDPTIDGGSGDGFDGWYNADVAKAELEAAIAELAQVGVEVSAENPIYIDYPYRAYNETATNQANVVKQSIEKVLDNKVIVNLIAMADTNEMQGATYRFSNGAEANFDLSTGSGWGPDYGDAQSYLDTIQAYGYMAKNIGLF